METAMNDPINFRTLSAGNMPLDEIDPAFDPAEDDYLDRCLFEIRESLTDYRNA
jgi:hypothetical protein